jgi:hypothetical protein
LAPQGAFAIFKYKINNMNKFEVTLTKVGGGSTIKTQVTCHQNDARKIAENQNPGYRAMAVKQL